MTHGKGMAPKKWEEAYASGTPHWAEDMEPSQFAQEFVLELRERKLNKVLEIGCGNGRDSILFTQAGLSVTCVDVAPSAVELAKINIIKAGVEIDVQVANAEKLQFKNAEFEAVFSLSVLHATDLDKSMPEIYRVLKHGGFSFIYIYGDTQFANGKSKVIVDVNIYIKLLKSIGFIIWDFYTEDEKLFDEFGEKHKLIVAFLGKG